MGINVNDTPPGAQVVRPATCLSAWLGESVDRVEVARGVLRRLDEWVARLQAGDHRHVRERWIESCGMLNERVSVDSPEGRYVGRVLDIGPEGELTLACDSGARVRLSIRNARLDAR
jgi:biotin-(acetyl-CoA carboxylase) ligase